MWNKQIIFFSFLFFFLLSYCVQVQLSPYPLTTPPHLSHPHLPPSILPPFGVVHVSFIHVPENPPPFSPHYPFLSPLWLLSVRDNLRDRGKNVYQQNKRFF